MIRIAIADDDAAFLAKIEKYIQKYQKENGEDIQLTAFSDAKELIEGYSPVYDIVILDIEMPGVNGLKAAEEIRKTNKECSIIFLTAFEDFSYAKKAILVRALDYLLKPGTEEELVAVLEEAIRLLEEKADGSQKNVREKPVDMQEKKKIA